MPWRFWSADSLTITYCPAGRFFPGIPNGVCFREWNNSIVMDELEKYGRIYAQEHPVA